MTHPIFWVCYDYGQGAAWALVHAKSAEQVRARFPQLKVYEATPTILNEEDRARISRSGVQDMEAPTGWLACLLPPRAQAIASAAEFRRLLELVQQQLRDGTLKQCGASHSHVPSVEVLQLPLGGPWPDIVEADFVDADGRPYHLFVDCYHGTGVWQGPTTVDSTRLRVMSEQVGRFEELPSWEFEVREVSAGVYRATGTDREGHHVVTEGVDADASLEACRSAALLFVRGR
jgi:hypothetical protein